MKNNASKYTLYRTCGTCNKEFMTNVDGFHRVLKNKDGYHTTYYCTEGCLKKSYSYDMFANQIEKRKTKDQQRLESEKYKEYKRQYNKEYYEKNKEKVKSKVKEYRQEHYEQCLESVRFNHQKERMKCLSV